ncbi:MAG: hypothetical protein KGJ37_05425, partial [Verrucomicrobiota bacterium]|nr:hypothetical protein [Verrucomicrobiota bacterium]
MVRFAHLLLAGSTIFLVGEIGMADDKPHSSSQSVSNTIITGLPKFDSRPTNQDRTSNVAEKPAAAGYVFDSPTFVIHSPSLPSEAQMLTPKGRTEMMMNRYLGRANGLDRGLLNRVTLPELWQKIPILGRIPFNAGGMTNEARAMMLYEDARQVPMKNRSNIR